VKEYSVFKVILPLHAQPRRISSSSSYSLNSSHSQSSTPEDETETKYLNILVADDNSVNRRLMTQILEKRGHSVESAMNGEEAIEVFEENGGHDFFNVILVDEEMPKLNGIGVVLHIREMETKLNDKYVPILSISGNWSAQHVKRTLEAGADATCSKPFKVNDFIQLVETHGYKNPL
jgi:two-component system sensor histidine kinase RpfC